jgi:hypothetical protein
MNLKRRDTVVKYIRAYLYKGSTVVIDKKDIKNSTDNDFVEISLFLSEDFIRNCAEELEMLSDE